LVGGEPTKIIVDPNEGGSGSSLRLVEVRWGRLVDVYDSVDHDGNVQTPAVRSLVFRDFVVGQEVIGDGFNYALEVSPFTEKAELTILAERESAQFEDLLRTAVVNLGFVAPTGLGPSFLPPYPLVPRNAAIVLRFSDLIDHGSIQPATVKLSVGAPPTGPFDARIIPDPNHGALIPDGGGQFVFRTTRVIVDLTVSEAEAQGTSTPVNSVGLPSGVSNTLVGALIRIPTRVDSDSGQFQILKNLAGKGLDASSNGPADTNATRDVLRAFRPGRSDDEPTNNDPNNGFLLDVEAPRVLGSQAVSVTTAPVRVTPDVDESADALVFVVGFEFAAPGCALQPRVGDVLRMVGGQFSELFARVIKPAAPPQGATVSDVRVELLRIPSGASVPALEADFATVSSGRMQTTWSPAIASPAECFIQVSPPPVTPPATGIGGQPVFTVRFTEPMDPRSVRPFDTFRLARLADSAGTLGVNDRLVGDVTASPDLRSFSWRPVTPINHVQGVPDPVFLNVVGGNGGVTDLGGNAIADPLPPNLEFTLLPSVPTATTGGIVLTFSKIDEDGNGTPLSPLPELRGQFTYDLARGVITPRGVARDSRVVDRTSPLYSVMIYTGAPIITPLAPLGSRMMTVWRYADVGYGVLDETTTNIDIEGISWSPFGGSVSTDFFSEFEVVLAHSSRLPDEYPIPLTQGGGGYAAFPDSGLVGVFDDNYQDKLKAVVHPRSAGYLIRPSDVYVSSTGLPMMPYPLNRSVALSDFEYYTWRDTALLGRGGTFGFGVDLRALVSIGTLCLNKFPTIYERDQIRSIGLPLLIEIKCFPEDGAIGLNGLDTSFALNTSPQPNFRAFSTGGFNSSGAPLKKNPDSQSNATGGFTPGGSKVPGLDNTVMHGQLDTVVRVSRVHSVWFPAPVNSPDYADPIVEPSPAQQPTDTRVVFAYRGATSVTGADVGDARKYDAYGDPLETRVVSGPACVPNAMVDTVTVTTSDIVPVFFQGDDTWRSSIHDIDSAPWFQVRMTFVGNAATGLTPELSTFAVAVRQ
jgi:hypothetical protein